MVTEIDFEIADESNEHILLFYEAADPDSDTVYNLSVPDSLFLHNKKPIIESCVVLVQVSATLDARIYSDKSGDTPTWKENFSSAQYFPLDIQNQVLWTTIKLIFGATQTGYMYIGLTVRK